VCNQADHELMWRLPHIYINVPALRQGTVGGYAVALVSVGVAIVLRLAVDAYVVGVPFVTFWPAVIITALISGAGAGLFCVVLSAAAAAFFAIDPRLSFYIENRADLDDLLLFLLLACFSVIVITQLHDAIERERVERALRQSNEEWAEREHLLTRESAHRTKNLISVVDAIARQTAAKNPEDFIERFSDRMKALSANQDLLAHGEWKGVEIKGLVHAQLACFADLIGSRISTDGPRLSAKPNAAEAIGLALHELVTNAGKYGALSTDMGRVDIRWGTDGETFTMSWAERGGPPVSVPQRRGFGTIVMQAMAERKAERQPRCHSQIPEISFEP
jgi:two-component sensor histidine kinase